MSLSRALRPATPDETRSLVANGERPQTDSATVEVLTVEMGRLAVGEEWNDEGPILFFELGHGELLVLWGQWLYDPHVVTSELLDIDALWERNRWFKHFELVRSPFSGLVLSLKSIGSETVTSVGMVRARQCLPPRPSELFQGSLDALLRESTDAPSVRRI
jgi:hypothetical protein